MDPLKGAVDEVLLGNTIVDGIEKRILPQLRQMLDGKAVRLATDGPLFIGPWRISGTLTIELIGTTKGNT